eukprot:COSAG04_NODE_15293_length_536_cov_1.748284_1_plen_130_part_10
MAMESIIEDTVPVLAVEAKLPTIHVPEVRVPDIQPQVSAKRKVKRAARKEHYHSLSVPDLFATAAAELNRASDERLIHGALESDDPRARMIELLLERNRELDLARGDLEEDEESDDADDADEPRQAEMVP